MNNSQCPVKTGLAYVEDVMIECRARLLSYWAGEMPFDRDSARHMADHLGRALGLPRLPSEGEPA